MVNNFYKKITVFVFSIMIVLPIIFLLFTNNTWVGLDESVVEKVSEENGHPASSPLINTDRGDLLLYLFTLAGFGGGLIVGYNYRKLFSGDESC